MRLQAQRLPANAIQVGVTAYDSETGGYLSWRDHVRDKHAFAHITSATDTDLVTGVTSQTVYICGFEPKFAGTATVYVENDGGTSSSCGGTHSRRSVASIQVQRRVSPASTIRSGAASKTHRAMGFCAKSTGTGDVSVDLWYAPLLIINHLVLIMAASLALCPASSFAGSLKGAGSTGTPAVTPPPLSWAVTFTASSPWTVQNDTTGPQTVYTAASIGTANANRWVIACFQGYGPFTAVTIGGVSATRAVDFGIV